jgi:trimeric autotransporter adhesin
LATVSALGLVLAIDPGPVTITASLNGVNGTLALNVSSAVLQSITVTAPNSSFALGFNLQLTATGNYSDGSTQDLTAAVQWSSSNTAIAVISNLGLMTGISVGPINVTASLQGVTGTLSVTVSAATLVSVSISPLTVNILNLLTDQQFTLTGTFSDGSTQTLSSGTYWTCSNPLLGLLSSTGLLSPLAIGNFTVTGTYNGLSATAAVNIL